MFDTNYGEAIAILTDSNIQISYKDLLEASIEIKQALPSGSLVLLIADNSFESILIYYSCIRHKIPLMILSHDTDDDQLDHIKSNYRPKLGLSFRYPKYDLDDSAKDEDLRGGLSFSFPLFNFGRGSADVGAAKARVSQSKFTYNQTVRDEEKTRANIFGAAIGIIQARSKTKSKYFWFSNRAYSSKK